MFSTFQRNHIFPRVCILTLLMLAALLCAFVLKPSSKMSEVKKSVNFDAIIPLSFGGWSINKSVGNQIVDPEVKATLASVYSQTVSRTYKNSNDQRIMLSVAYGGDQDEVMQVHKPEVCYTAQGFSVTNKGTAAIKTDKGTVLAKQLLTKQAERVEPVTYWITIGNSIALNGMQWRWERIKYGLTGELPDGLLFRVSSIGRDTQLQYDLHKLFIRDLFNHLSQQQAQQFIGNLAIE